MGMRLVEVLQGHDDGGLDRRNHEGREVREVRGRDPQGRRIRGNQVHGRVLLAFRSVHRDGLGHARGDRDRGDRDHRGRDREDREDRGREVHEVQLVELEE